MPYKPHFWVREEKNTNSEVELVYQYEKYVVPIEVKSGKQGKLKSLHQFVERTNYNKYINSLYSNVTHKNNGLKVTFIRFIESGN
ncbi:MAG: hypothetical protein NWS46_09290 [Cyclobacteriaceae bacterium]|nr:hypothetical protein [Cyclobacteriaceae bacterium]